ncbi:MAG: hypothetical protein ACRDGW_12025, partial [Actinomycetota bacterium]
MTARTKKAPRSATSSSPARSSTKNGKAVADEAVLQEVLDALVALKQGDFDVRLPPRRAGLPGKIALAFNDCVGLIAKT